jgi:hypothetical protein
MSVSESVAATLEGRIRLLVFDNCEHSSTRPRISSGPFLRAPPP